ncbi:MAG: FAD-dependent oxidoreductase, partial [Thermodesulfobacteriota bacterium]
MQKKLSVYICGGCGIGEALNLEALKKAGAKSAQGPCQIHPRLCGPEGVALLKKDVAEQGVNGLIIAACSPRVMYDVFDFPGCLVERVNLREQVVWCRPPDSDQEDIQALAEDYLRMGVVKIKKMEPPEAYKPDREISKDILIVGGGIAGLTAALDVSKAGYKAILVEKEAKLGGFQKNVARRATYPYKEVTDNPLDRLIKDVTENPRITVYTNATVEKTEGGPCLFKAVIRQNGDTEEINAGAIVLAAGWKPYDPSLLPQKLGYGRSDKIVTNAWFEEKGLAGSKPKNVAFLQCAGSRDENHLPYCSTVCCLASLKQAVQLKEADPEANVFVVFKELRTPGQAEDFYRKAQESGVTFIRCQDPEVVVSGSKVTVKGLDDLLNEEVELPELDLVVLATGMVPVTALGVDVKKKEEAEKKEEPAKKESEALPVPVDVIRASDCLNLAYRQGPELPDLKYGFPDSHFVCFPYESRRTGIYPAGCVRRPMNSASTFEDATGAAMKAIQAVELISQGKAVHPRSGDLSYPEINLSRCTQCRRCTDECPFGALNEDEKSNPLPQPTRCR